MSILLGKHDFAGPYLDPADVLEESGLLAILIQDLSASTLIANQSGNLEQQLDTFELFNLKESATLKESAKRIFETAAVSKIVSVAAYYMPDSDHSTRCRLRNEIMSEFEEELEEDKINEPREEKNQAAIVEIYQKFESSNIAAPSL